MRKAVIDLGTNTFNLLIGDMIDDQLNLVYTDKKPVLLGMGGINDRRISKDAIERAVEAMVEFKSQCDSHGVEKINAIGTSAIRDAVNQREFLEIIDEIAQIKVEVVSGMREAELIMKGVRLTHKFDRPTLIMDIGGGSTEFILCHKDEVLNSVSTNIGVSRLYQLLGKPMDYTADQMETVLVELEKYRAEFAAFCDAECLVGSSGSFETFYEMITKTPIPEIAKSQEMNFAAFEKALDWTISSHHNERIANPHIIPLRKDMIPIASLLIKWVLDQIGVHEVYVSPFSLKEGAFTE
jgi:exopolyphosphatase/guanosine-5'-triphosphate,3'-diphosphate pyrophosphatase